MKFTAAIIVFTVMVAAFMASTVTSKPQPALLHSYKAGTTGDSVTSDEAVQSQTHQGMHGYQHHAGAGTYDVSAMSGSVDVQSEDGILAFGVVTSPTSQPGPEDPPLPSDSPTSSKTLGDRILAKLEQHVDTLFDSVPAALYIGGSIFLTWMLNSEDCMNGLLAAAVAAGAIAVYILEDPETLRSIQFAVLASYLLFHVAYGRLRTTSLELGQGFVIAVTLAASIALFVFAQSFFLKEIWTEATGLHGVWSFLPIHLASFIVGGFVVIVMRAYW